MFANYKMPTILTNKQGLPETIVNACKYDTHKVAGDISVSQLISAPRERILKKLNKYEEDVSDRLYMLMGTALHHILERGNIPEVRRRSFLMVIETFMEGARKVEATDQNKAAQFKNVAKYLQDCIPVFFPEIGNRYIFEVTFRTEINGVVLYGTFDLYDTFTKTLYDYKFCSVYAYMFQESQMKWDAQTNVYAYLLTQNNYEVKHIKIVAFFRDWQSSGNLKQKDYPKHQVMEIDMPVRSIAEMANWINKRILKHKEAEDTGILPLCTGTERWAKGDQWAAKTPGVKKAWKVSDEESVIDAFIYDNQLKYQGKLFKEFRPGESVKCASFCPVAKFCDQREKELEIRLKNSNNE